MSFTVCGHCSTCQSPMYMPHAWMGIYPPSPQPTCRCATKPSTKLSPSDRGWVPQSRDIGDEDSGSMAELDRQIVQDKIRETRQMVESIRNQQKIAEKLAAEVEKVKNDMSGVPSLHQAMLTEDDLDVDGHPPVRYKKSDIDVRVDRLETMMVNLTVALGEVKQILTAKINSDADDGK